VGGSSRSAAKVKRKGRIPVKREKKTSPRIKAKHCEAAGLDTGAVHEGGQTRTHKSTTMGGGNRDVDYWVITDESVGV